MRCRLFTLVVPILATPTLLAAQGTLSTQGFGYPLGGLSTRAAASGGSAAEFDHLSSRNPAALGGWVRSGLYVQYDPEFRTVTAASASDRMTATRFGAIAAGFTVGSRTVIGLSSNSFLDRSFTTSVRSGALLGGDSVLFNETFASSGAIGDTRLGLSRVINGRLALGIGLHAYTGENRLRLTRLFDDSLRFGTLTRDLTLSYTGTGISGGVVVTPFRGLSLAASGRQGGSIKLRIVDTLRTRANVPNRYGFAVRFDGIPGMSIAASGDHVEWSRMNALGTAGAAAADAWEYAVGAEFSGPRSRGATPSYSLGYRSRDLPFTAAGALVTETSFTGGTSIPLSGGRALFDIALQRANRDAAGSVKERAWLLSVGLTVRP